MAGRSRYKREQIHVSYQKTLLNVWVLLVFKA